MKDFLLEIGTEELPASFANEAREQFKTIAEKWLKDNNLTFEKVKTFSTPRRLVLLIEKPSESQPDIEKEFKGPSLSAAYDTEGKPTKALEGFCKAQNLSFDQLEKKDFKGNMFVFAKIKQHGKKSIELFPELINHLITSVSVIRGMRWADYTVKFSRPIQWILCLFGAEVVNFETECLKTSNFTYGHRFLSKGQPTITSIDQYFETLEKNFVIVDNEKRKEIIREQLKNIAESLGADVLISESLLTEVNQLVEYPTAIMGDFEETYLQIPQVVNVTVMKSHQRYFPLFDKSGTLLPNFITISNMHLNKANIKAGNEKVLRARLEDAMFFYKEDQKTSLAEKTDELKRVTYFEEIGSMYDKTQRIEANAVFLAQHYFPSLDLKKVIRAGKLSKADLVTNMVKEFTELQGEIGYYYSLEKEGSDIATALKEQYLPTGNNDSMPSEPLSQVINFADKLDNIISCFALGKIPTGSKDPFSLRRQSLGIIKTCNEYKIALNLQDVLNNAFDVLAEQKSIKANKEETVAKITEFVLQRLKNDLLDRGFKHDLVEAVLDSDKNLENVFGIQEKVSILAEWLETEASKNTVMALARVSRIAKEKGSSEVNHEFFEKEQEKELFDSLNTLNLDFAYTDLLNALEKLVAPINAFFDNVMVMVDNQDVKNNRLCLLNKIKDLSLKVANMDKIII